MNKSNHVQTLTFRVLFVALGFLALTSSGRSQTPIANSTVDEFTESIAYDGTTFLVGLLGLSGNPSGVGAQLVAPTGSLVGAPIDTGRTGEWPYMAFGGGTYLLVWSDDSGPSLDIWGTLVSPTGLVGSPFAISTGVNDEEVHGIAFDGVTFLVTWAVDVAVDEEVVWGRRVSSGGIPLGSSFQISSGRGAAGLNGTAFAPVSNRYLIAWREDTNDTDVQCRVVDPSGGLGAQLTIHSGTGDVDSSVCVGTDGTDFLVLWSCDLSGAGNYEIMGQRVSVSPTLSTIGGVIRLTNDGGSQLGPFVAFDGTQYLVTWTTLTNDIDGDESCDSNESTCFDAAARFLSPSGALVGSTFGVCSEFGHQGGTPVSWDPASGRFLVAYADQNNTFDVHGVLIDPASSCQSAAAYCTSKVNSFGCTPLVQHQGMSSATTGSGFSVKAVNVVNQQVGILFYSLQGSASITFGGGVLCALPPVHRSPPVNSGGTPGPSSDCSGILSIDFNAFAAGALGGFPSPALQTPGTSVWAQFWSRDPGFAPPGNYQLPNAISFTVCP